MSFLAILIGSLLAGCTSMASAPRSDFDDFLGRIRGVVMSGRLSDTTYVASKLGCGVEVLNDPLRPEGAEIHDYVLYDCPSPVSKGERAITLYGTRGPDGKTKGAYIDFNAFDWDKLPPKAEVMSIATRRFGQPKCKDEMREGTRFTYCSFAPSEQLPVGIGLMYQNGDLFLGLSIWGYD
ncbi:hypothetical protein [Burkholderia pyrrocinia]|uniref:hypothetical protein n=1 Tax=Burkholderia pyrrocinia TaxID=60550 RepID=UPI001BCB83CA|nr:hypothetical protein [Burkholderia pyrrocinia]QVN20028.1 hypothetical protein JYG32_25810 [Burkholderia pyrrocinia]